jgi:phosphoserine phosphatase
VAGDEADNELARPRTSPVNRGWHWPLVLVLLLQFSTPAASQVPDPLSTWTDGGARDVILQFVGRVTDPDSDEYVPPMARIAVFDNDGTLWSERPWIEGLFWQKLLRDAAEANPELHDVQPYQAALGFDEVFFENGGYRQAAAHVRDYVATLEREAFDNKVRAFFRARRHPDLDVPLSQTVYQPALELLDYLRANDFRVFICSGGGADFIRVIAGDFYGIESDRVIGTSYKKSLQFVEGRAVLRMTGELNTFNNRDEKAVNIDLHIGQRPLLVMGNAGGAGDIGMLSYSQGRAGPSLQLLIEHDDAEREYAYAEDDNASLAAAEANGWTVVSVKDDWSAVYGKPVPRRQRSDR